MRIITLAVLGPSHLIKYIYPSKAPFKERLFLDKVPFLVRTLTQSG